MVRFWAYFEKRVNCTCQHVKKTRKGKDQNENLELPFITMINSVRKEGGHGWGTGGQLLLRLTSGHVYLEMAISQEDH